MAMDYSRAADWIVAEDSFDPEYLGKCESIMCQGNGYLCLRNATDEFNPGEQRDLFVAGTFNKFDDNEVTELPNAADISRLDLRLDGVRFSLLTGKVESYDRALNLKTGETTRRVVWAAPNGKRYQLVFSRFVSLDRLHLIAQKVEVTPLDGDMELDITGGINGQMNNGGSQHFSEGDKRLFEGRHMASAWIKYVTSVDGETIWCTGAGCLPPRADAAEAMDIDSDPVWKVHSEMTDCSLPWQLGNNASIINTAYQNYFPLAVSGEMTAAEFLKAAEDQANQEIANAG